MRCLKHPKQVKFFQENYLLYPNNYGIRGFIDEVWMTPDEFIIIDDKPGTVAYSSSINQVYGYCLAFKEMVPEKRRIVASLRERGTENIYWASYFDEKAEKDIINLINRMHRLLDGEIEFKATDNPNKCRGCRFNTLCERKTGFLRSVKPCRYL